MAFGKKSNKGTDYDIAVGEEKLKSIIGGQIVRNRDFYKKMAMNGIRNTPKAWHKINSQIRKELKEGTLYPDDIEKRIDELIVEISPNSILISENEVDAMKLDKVKNDILSKGHVAVSIPYQKSGVNDAIVGGAFLGEWGTVLGALNEGNTSWKTTDLLFMEDGINIKSTGHVILYEDVKKVILGEKGIVFTIVTIITNFGENFVYRTGNQNAIASKSIIEDNMPKMIPNLTSKTVKSNNNMANKYDEADILLKYAELYEKGLLTKEEFDMKKAELLGTNDNEVVESEDKYSLKQNFIDENHTDQQGTQPKFCTSCGSPIDEGSNFCTNCGAKLN